jgi:hypothetical protein
MKNLKLTSISSLAFMMSLLLYVSCQDQESIPKLEETLEINQSVKAKFEELGFDVSDIKMSDDSELLDPAYEGGKYVLENDIIISPENLLAMLGSDISHKGAVGEQYRTSNLVSGPRTINVIGYTGGSNALNSTMRTALQWAIDNYNALNIGLNFTLTFGTSNYQSYDIVVYKVSGGGGGSAGFPTNGNPYQYVQIQSGTSNYGTNTTEHVMTHEIGHTLGLRHTDYFNRSLSCGSGGNEGDGGVGAIHITGTPTGFDANSVMLSCFSANEDGEFGSFDVVALEYLY